MEKKAHEQEHRDLSSAFKTLNHEMGVVEGELKWIKLLMGATVLIQMANLFKLGG